MKEKRNIIIIGMAVVLFILLVKVISDRAIGQVSVVVPKSKINAREKITKDQLKLIKIPRKLVSKEIVVTKNDLTDHYVALNHTLYENMPILKHSVEHIDQAHDRAFLKLNKNEQVFSMKTGVVESFGNTLNEGHRVDLYLNPNKEGKAKLIAENVRVLGVKDRYGEDVIKGDTQANLVLLAIDETYISQLLDAQSLGYISMTLRQGTEKETKYFSLEPSDD